MPAVARLIEEFGFDGLWTAEAGMDGFLPHVLAAEHTERLSLGTSIATAFPRTPAILANLAWDLARYSDGRFILGLGAQVKAHNERRLGVKWERPLRRMRETIEAVRAIWDTWQNGAALHYEGEFFNISLMPPFFSADPLDVPEPPIYISTVNRGMLQLAGSLCDGALLHPFHSVKYLREFAWPNITAGLSEAGRGREAFTAVGSVMVVPTDGEKAAGEYEAHTRSQISFYMSTPAYRVVSELHGWTGVAEELSNLARNGEWAAMSARITDEMLDTFAISGKWGDLPRLIKESRGEFFDRVNLYISFVPGEDDSGWRAAIAGF